ncbi:MAG: hypothetical protein M1818_002687 [Claussenomyces sp. TS43310]|nr:MAG: hypothetical protein M1818_002687 [Claussenomyces sp. TS43310]
MFHATLKYYTQWCDDLSMLLAVALVMHRVYTANTSIRTTILAGLGLSAVLGGFAVWHCITDDIGWHNLIFGIMICLVGIKTHAVIDSRVDDPLVRREVVKMSIVGGTIFVSGFAIWNLDNFFCNGLTHAKRGIGMPWSFLLELHGYWHIFTGIGAYIFMALVEYLTSEEAGEPLGGRFAWPVPWIVDGSASTGREREALLPTASDAAADTSGGADALVLKINQD